MSLAQRAVKGVVWSALQNWGGRTIDLAVFVTLARFIAPESFGIVAMASIFVALMEIFLGLGFSSAIVQRKNLDEEHLDSAFWSIFALGILFAQIGVSGSDSIERLFDTAGLSPVIKWLSAVFVINGLTAVQVALLRRRMQFKLLAVRTLTASFISGLVAISMAINGFGIWSLVVQQILRATIASIMLWTTCDWRPGVKVSIPHFLEMWGFSKNVIGINALTFVNRRADQLLIGYFLGPVALGYYTVGYRILLILIQLLVSTISQVAMPVFSRLQEDFPRLREGVLTATNLASFISFPVFLFLAVIAPLLVPLLFGDQWAPSIPVMQVLSLIGVVQSVTSFNWQILLAVGKSSWVLGLGTVNTIANIIAFSIAVHWGIVAVAAAFVIRGHLLAPLDMAVVTKLIDLRAKKYISSFAGPAIASIAMCIIVLLVKNEIMFLESKVLQLLVCTFVSIFSYISFILLIDKATLVKATEILRKVF